MSTTIKLPELGENVDSGELTRILVSVGDTISKDQPLLELETEKATIEVPSPVSGVIKELHVQQGRQVKVGDPLFTVDENGASAKPEARRQEIGRQPKEDAPQQAPPKPVKSGQRAVEKERQAGSGGVKPPAPPPQAAAPAMAPAKKTTPEARPVPRSEPIAEPSAIGAQPKKAETEPQRRKAKPALRTEPSAGIKQEPFTGEATEKEAEAPAEAEEGETVIPFRTEPPEEPKRHLAPASPSIRRLARELGVDINKVVGTGPEGRIDEQDVKNYAREAIARAGGAQLPRETFAEMPDFGKWGAIERKPMTNVRRVTAERLAQAWRNVPQVTQFDNADVTELENLRTRFSERQDSGAPKITVTAVALKIVAAALARFPQFGASVDMANREIIYKRYCNIGIAVDTSYGLVVPVVRDADQKSIPQLARELADLSERAREKKLALDEMAGGVFTITNLGGIGGTGFSPIVNYPQVAILGISRLTVEPRHIEGSFQPRKILPLSLSYDHRLIDGADAARFLRWVAEALEEPASLLFRD